MWWAVVTLATVGYGDVVPITLGGRIFTIIVLILGLLIVTVPAGLSATSLIKAREIQKPDNIKNKILEFICLDKKLKEKMCIKCYSIASSFSSNQKFIVYQWILLLLSEEKSLKINWNRL